MRVFGHWTCLYDAPYQIMLALNVPRLYMDCRCSCGVVRTVQWHALLRGDSLSCGHIRTGIKGAAKGLMYSAWAQMTYKARHGGTPVIKRWFKFSAFLADMGPRPPGKYLGRKNPKRGHSRTNSAWMPLAESKRANAKTRVRGVIKKKGGPQPKTPRG